MKIGHIVPFKAVNNLLVATGREGGTFAASAGRDENMIFWLLLVRVRAWKYARMKLFFVQVH